MSTHQKYKYKQERQKKKNMVNFFHAIRYDTKFAQLTRDVAVETYTGRYFRRSRELLQHSM